jgi:predicted nuclease of predicted toxin-antitoxin system
MNLSPRWVVFFNEQGFEVEHWSKLGPIDASDAEIMAFARLQNSIVVTHDLDFGAILAAGGGQKPSVVQIRSDNLDPEVIGKVVAQSIRHVEKELEDGALLTIDPKRSRLRMLPLLR